MSVVVSLRPVSSDDSARLFAWRNSPDVRAYMYTDHLITPEEHRRWFAAALVDPRRRYWIIEVDGEGVGLANLVELDFEDGSASWAYYIADPTQRGRGVGAMAEFRVIETAFGDLALSRLRCEVLETNAAVIKLHKRFGFVEESRLVARAIKGGAPVDAIGLSLTAAAWGAQRPAMIERLRGLGFQP